MAVKFKVVKTPPFQTVEIKTSVVSFKMEIAVYGIAKRRELLEEYKALLFSQKVETARVVDNQARDALAKASTDVDAFTAQWGITAKSDSNLQDALKEQDAVLVAFYYSMINRIYDLPIQVPNGDSALADTSDPTVLGLQDSQEALAVLLEELGDNPVVRDAITKAVDSVFTNINKDDAAVLN